MNELLLLIIKIILIIVGSTIIGGSIYPQKTKNGKIYHNIVIGISIISMGSCLYYLWNANTILEIILTFFVFVTSGYITIKEFEKKN